MRDKIFYGVYLFGFGIIITSLVHINKLIGNHDIYFYYYADLGFWGYVRYAFSWFQRIAGLTIGIGLLMQMNWARIGGMILGYFTMATIYWKHPYDAFHKHTQYLDSQFGFLLQEAGFQNISFESLTIASLVIHCFLDILFWGIFIYYMMRPEVRASFRSILKGIHYKNPYIYQMITKFLLGKKSCLRFEIAASYLLGSKSVLDLCAGTGLLKKFLPTDSSYTALDASPEFVRFLNKKHINGHLYSLEQLEKQDLFPGSFDAVVMVISLCQARPYHIDQVINGLKKTAKKCVIVEDVKERPMKWINRLMNYFCDRDYYKACAVFTRQEFETLMISYGFSVNHHDNRYSCAVYESKE